MAPLLRLYPFKYRDPVSGTWIKAGYKATIEDIRARYAEWMIAGEPEMRGSVQSMFNPHPRWTDDAVTAPAGPDAELLSIGLAQQPELDCLEAFLVATFLRRYVTYCARRRRYGAMQGAAKLLSEVQSTGSLHLAMP